MVSILIVLELLRLPPGQEEVPPTGWVSILIVLELLRLVFKTSGLGFDFIVSILIVLELLRLSKIEKLFCDLAKFQSLLCWNYCA